MRMLRWILFLFLIGGAVYHQQNIVIDVCFSAQKLWPGYQQRKALIAPYFDEAFYEKTYSQDLSKSFQKPIDHFLQRSGFWGFEHLDPNPWFHSSLYKERLWPCRGNALVDFLKQLPLSLPPDAPEMLVYANESQFTRAWMAVEALLRLNKYAVTLILPETLSDRPPQLFQPQCARGLKIAYSKDPQLSFYQSPFFHKPDEFCTLEPKTHAPEGESVTRVQRPDGRNYLMHRLYSYASWKEKGRINPLMINVAHFCFEPIEFSPYGKTEILFKESMQRLAPGFDLMLLNSNVETQNLRIVPGFMKSYIDPLEIPQKKAFEVSYLLSLGGKGPQNFKTRGSFIYHFRQQMWDLKSAINVPVKFYISKRDIEKFPEKDRSFALPTSSKAWIYGSQFTIAIENSRQKDYFSEKLLDCFLSLCVPIYIGCPNIHNYFDVRGMIIVATPQEAVEKANALTPDLYEKMLPFLVENQRRAKALLKLEDKYLDEFFDNISRSLSS